MIKKITVFTVTVLAALASSYGGINSVTGVGEGTPWERFSDQLQKDSAIRARFLAGLMGSSADPADAGAIRLGNADLIAWEASPAGTDVTLTVNSSEQFVFSAAILSPTLVTPSLGVATATSINGNIFTTGSSTYTGTAGQTYTFPTTTATIARTDAANTFTGASTATSWNIVSPVVTTGLTASGSAANDYSASTGTFLTSSGLNTFGGKAAFKVVATPVAAAGAGGGVSGAAQLGSANLVAISSDGATKGVKLATGVAGDVIWIINTSGTAANLFAASGGTINGGSANVGCAIPASKGVICYCTAADTWIVVDMTARAGAAA